MNNQEPVSATKRLRITKTETGVSKDDFIVGEEPLEIRIETEEGKQQLAITMRTPVQTMNSAQDSYGQKDYFAIEMI